MESKADREQHPAAKRGQDLHKNIEDYLLGKVDLMMELAYYRPFLDTIKSHGAEPELPLALTSDWKPTDWDNENRWWRGVLDCVVEDGPQAMIFDWKTGQEYGDHVDQREIYAAAFDSCRPEFQAYKVIHVYVDKKLNTVSNFTPEDLPKIRKKWEENVDKMFNDKRMPPNPGFYCRSCQFRRDNGGPCVF
jgi:hypothetical protein